MSTNASIDGKLGDLADILTTIGYLNEAVFMASTAIGCKHQRNAIQAVCDNIENRLVDIDAVIEGLRKEVRQ